VRYKKPAKRAPYTRGCMVFDPPGGRCVPGGLGSNVTEMEDLRLPFTQRISARQWVAIDVVLAVLLAAASASRVAFGPHSPPAGQAWVAVRYLAVALACGSLPFRRRFPIAVLCLVAVSVSLLEALAEQELTLLAVAMAVYSVAAASIGWISLGTVATAAGAIMVGALAAAGGPDGGLALSGLAVVLVGWLAGENTRARRIYVEAVTERAAERERESEERARRSGTEERVRIARELHDVVAHAMSIIAVRSGVARMVIDTQPGEAREALGIIEDTSRQALDELRLLFGVLRRAEPDGTPAELGPVPGLADLPELMTQITDAGVAVSIHVEGQSRRLPPGVDLSAYRIVQEALTNVVRHAGPAAAKLTLRYRPAEIQIEVTDDGQARDDHAFPPPHDGDGRGQGLVGMRERATLYGGQLLAEPTPCGFRVLARIPTDEAAS
jgi:signal transduction histidine kinase